LTGQIPADAGTIKRADSLRVVYFDQQREDLDGKLSLKDALSPNSDNVVYQGSSMHVTGWAKRFLFGMDQMNQPVSRLSGGERARVLIARLMLQPADLLILDEPTNDLDIPTLEVLEESLTTFAGAILLVTHDRFLLDTVSTDVLALDGCGGYRYFAGYAQWEKHKDDKFRQVEPKKAAAGPRAPSTAPDLKQLKALKRELAQLEERIEAADRHIVELQERMTQPEVAANHVQLAELWQTLETAQTDVKMLYSRWEELDQALENK